MGNVRIAVPEVEALKDERSNKVKRYVRLTMALAALKAETERTRTAFRQTLESLTGGELARGTRILAERVADKEEV